MTIRNSKVRILLYDNYKKNTLTTATDFCPLIKQEAISSLKSQYELEDGELESVIQNLWNEDSLGYSGGVMPPTSAAANVLSPEEPYITLPRSENFYNNYLNMYN